MKATYESGSEILQSSFDDLENEINRSALNIEPVGSASDGRLFFKNTKNMIAEINTLVSSYDNESARKELREFLEESFTPTLNDCYQNVMVFPAIDDINLTDDKVTLVLFEPYIEGGLHPDLQSFYDDALRKNRVMFLSGQRNTMDKLLQTAKELKAIQVIISRMDGERVNKNDPQYIKANEKLDKITLNLLQTARETFVTLYYPSKKDLMKADFLMQFTNNEFDGEKQVKDVLLQRQKFTEDVTGDTFRKKCEDRLFTQKEMRWVDVKARASINPAWQWHLPRALDDLKDDMLKKGKWRESGGYIEKPPFPLEKTDVIIQELHRDDNTGAATLRISPKYGDNVLYEIDGPATSASLLVEKPKEFKTKDLKLSFLCIDSSEDHETGDPREWTNKITLQYRVYDKEDNKFVELKSAPNVPIRYTTDGSNPKEHGGIYSGEFVVPDKSTHVLAIAEKKGIYSDLLTIQIIHGPEEPVEIDKTKPLTLNRKIKTNDTKETYTETDQIKKHKAKLCEVTVTFFRTKEETKEKGWIELSIDRSTEVDPEILEIEMDNIRSNFLKDGKVNISLGYSAIQFPSGQHFLDWVAEKKLSLTGILH